MEFSLRCHQHSTSTLKGVRPPKKKKIVMLPSSEISKKLDWYFIIIIIFKALESTKCIAFQPFSLKTPNVNKIGC